MENNQSYFGGIKDAVKSLLTGLGVTWREYFTPKVTEQYPENRKTVLHVASRHRGRLIMPQDAEGNNKCIACTLCEKACPNGTITIKSEMVEVDGKNKRKLVDYQYDLGECMFCQLCVNVCPQDAIKFVNEFENSTFSRDSLVLHLDKEKFEPVLPELIEGGADMEIGKFNTGTK